ncbi:LysR substrate-binding domain-containing protein [Roseobacter sinensis]|uniref:LysR substrate-binding domain-containing protein n=1 Tax=Roseobacter sinensis TaxID=2931391 RepID=A0ABT3B9R7_9RHOB|nr:LysR substrate-binding domain-containing protein [Roseobacter sp. WL0113]MCV3269939.1 LysR substrate-binding domain-containing protein [Roseobacter sp. WL0113]
MSRSPLPPLAAARVFEAAARHGNFTAAASELGMTQAAVSYQIKVLEERVGAPLFHRQPRGVRVTAVGARLADRMTASFDMIADAYAEARGTSQGLLSISAIPTFATNFLARRLGRFQMANPDIAVRIEVSETLIDFNATGFDVAIRGGKGDWPGLTSHLIMKTAFTPMLSPALAETVGGVKTPEDLAKLPILAPADPWWRFWFEAAGASMAEFDKGAAGNFGPMVIEANAAMAGHGVAMLTPDFFREEIELGLLVQPFELACDNGSAYWLTYPESRRTSPKIRTFRKWLDAEMERFNS